MIDCLYGKQITMCLYRDTHDLFSQTTTPQKENVSSIFHSFGPTSSHNPHNPRWLSRPFQESLKDLFLRIQVLIRLHFIVAASCCCCCFYFSLASTSTRESTRQKLDYPQIVHWFISLSQAFNEEKRNHINNSTKSCHSPEFSWTWGSGGEDKKGVWVATWMDSSSASRQAWPWPLPGLALGGTKYSVLIFWVHFGIPGPHQESHVDHKKSWRKFSAICVSKWLPTLVRGEVTRVQPSLVWRFWWDKSQNFSLGPATWENRPHLHCSHVYYFSLLLSVTFFKPGQFFFLSLFHLQRSHSKAAVCSIYA